MTPYLEQMINSGDAAAKTFSFGMGGVMRLPVPPGSLVIVNRIKWFGLRDVQTNGGPNFDFTWSNKMTTQLQLVSRKSKNVMVFRDPLWMEPLPGGNPLIDPPWGMPPPPVIRDTYFVYDSDVSINLCHLGPWADIQAASITAPMPNDSQENEPINGYGIAALAARPTLQWILVDGAGFLFYMPTGRDGTVAFNPNHTDQLRSDQRVNPISNPPATTEQRDWAYTIFSFDYVQIHKKSTFTIQPSN